MTDILATRTRVLAAYIHDLEKDQDPFDRVLLLRLIRDHATSALRDAVPAAVAGGHSWSQVGEALDVSAQAAHQRYAHFNVEPRR